MKQKDPYDSLRKITFLIILAATVAGLAYLYRPTLGYYFLHEDADFVCFINEPGAIYHPDQWGFRLLGDLMRWDFFLSGKNPVGYHIFNLTVHLIVCFLLFLICRRLNLGKIPGTLAVLLFSLHPWVFSDVGWIAGRLDIDETIWLFATILAYDKYLASQASPAKRWYLVALFLYLAALLSKETAYIIPLILIPWEYAVSGKIKWKRGLFNSGIFATLVLALVLFRLCIGAPMGVYGSELHSRIGLFQLENLWLYLGLLFANDLVEPSKLIISIISLSLISSLLIVDRRALFITLLLFLPILIVTNLTVQTWYLYLPAASFTIIMAIYLELVFNLKKIPSVLRYSLFSITLVIFLGGYTLIHLPRTLNIRQLDRVGSEFLSGLMHQFDREENRPPRPSSIIVLQGLPENVEGYTVYSDEIGFDLDLIVNDNVKHGTKYLMDTSHTMVFTPKELLEFRDQIETFPLPTLFYTLKNGKLSRDKEAEARYIANRMKQQNKLYKSETFFTPSVVILGAKGLDVIGKQGYVVLKGKGTVFIDNLRPNLDYAFYLKIRSDSANMLSSDIRQLALPGDDSFADRLFAARSDDMGRVTITVENSSRMEINYLIYGPLPPYFPPS